jgi:ATP-dependent Clp protease protease subunit
MNVFFGTKPKTEEETEDEEEKEESILYRENNRIFFYSEIDRKSAQTLIQLIREAEQYSFVTAFQLGLESIPIYLHLSSQGGFVYDALSVVDAIQRCRIPIYSVVEGSVASAGTFISIVCQKRFICPHAFMLVHQLSGEVGGKMAEMTDEYANLTELMEVIKKLYSEHTRMSEKVLRRLLKHDLYLNAEKALKYGLADELYS